MEFFLCTCYKTTNKTYIVAKFYALLAECDQSCARNTATIEANHTPQCIVRGRYSRAILVLIASTPKPLSSFSASLYMERPHAAQHPVQYVRRAHNPRAANLGAAQQPANSASFGTPHKVILERSEEESFMSQSPPELDEEVIRSTHVYFDEGGSNLILPMHVSLYAVYSRCIVCVYR